MDVPAEALTAVKPPSLDGTSEAHKVKLAELADYYYKWVQTHLISQQSPALGLFLRSRSSHVTDNVYCSVSIWALSKVFERLNDGSGRFIELQQTAIKTMRAILFCFSKQLDKLEKFKYQQDPQYCLHLKFDPKTGDEIKQNYQHMQIRSVSLYLFYLAQMIKSRLVLIYTLEECHIIQNLIYYVERAYRIKDFGMWGQGKKDKPEDPELSASTIGMTIAALKACDGLNVFGEGCSHDSVLFVDPDAVFRNVSILQSLLPRESRSKDVDAALLMTKGFPAFAVDDHELCLQIENNVDSELLGFCGYKRFIGDKFGQSDDFYISESIDNSTNPLESSSELEWPFIILFQIITCVFENRQHDIPKYRAILDSVISKVNGYPTVPLYATTKGEIAIKNQCTTVFQAFLILTELLENQLVFPHDLDYRRQSQDSKIRSDKRTPIIQIALLAESTAFQALLSTYGISTQTPNQIESVYVWPSSKLVDLLYHHGSDSKLGLTGRPKRPLGSLCTSRVWKVDGKTVMCIPLYQDEQDFYISKDETSTAKSIKTHIKFLKAHWREQARPTFCILLTSVLFKKSSKTLFKLLNILTAGKFKDIPIKTGRLQELITASSKMTIVNCCLDMNFHTNRILASPKLSRKTLSIKSLAESEVDSSETANDFKEVPVHKTYDSMLTESKLLSDHELLSQATVEHTTAAKIVALIEIANRNGPDCKVNGDTVDERIENHYRTIEGDWLALRCCAGFLNKTVDSLAPSVSAVIVSGRSLSLGVYGQPEVLIEGPLHPRLLEEILHKNVRHQSLLHAALQQEFLIYIAELLVDHPELFKGIMMIRVGHMIHVMQSMGVENEMPLESLPPHQLSKKIRLMLANSNDFSKNGSWQKHRLISGTLGRVPEDFSSRVWLILQHQNIRFTSEGTQLGSHDTLNTKVSEPLFAMKIERFLNTFSSHNVRYFAIELLHLLASVIERNPEVILVEEFPVQHFIELSKVNVEESLEDVSKKFISCMIKNEFVKIDNVHNCIVS